MTDKPQLRLDDSDLDAGAAALREQLPDVKHAVTVVFNVVAAINEARGGEPIGTVRHCENGSVAVRIRTDAGIYCWKMVHPNGNVNETDGPLNPEIWPLHPLYRESAQA